MCLRAQGIDNDDGGVGRGKRDRGLKNDGGGINRGRVIYNTAEGLETKTEAAGAR